MKFKLNKKDFLKLFFLSLIFVIPKWSLSYFFFDEDISLRVINEIEGDGEFYLSLMRSLAEFDFTNTYSFERQNNGSLPVPIGTLFLHSLSYIFIGSYSIILLEFVYVFFVLFFLSLIQNTYFHRKNIVYISFLILLIPTIIISINFDKFQYLNIISSNFFSLRLHRPLGTTIFLVIFIYILINIFETNFNKKNSFFLGLVLGLTFSGFYYFFIIQIISLFILILINFNFKILSFFKLHFSNILIIGLGFLIFATPFVLLNMIFAEPDYAERLGDVSLSKDKKLILLKYYLGLFLNFKFLSLILINSAIFLFLIKLRIKNILFYKIPFVIFISSIISPILFFLISPKTTLIYHFNNNIIICSFLSIIFFIVTLYHCYLKDKKFLKLDYIIYLIIIFSIFNISILHLDKNNVFKEERKELSTVSKILQNHDLTKLSILTFDNKIIMWSIMYNIKDLKVINGLLLPRKNDQIENDVISAFKFLNLDSKTFSKFIENKDQNWRYFNRNISNLFYAKYQANNFTTYDNSNDFNKDELQKILKSPPSRNQQLILPIIEIERLKNKFKSRIEKYKILPDYIILNKSNFIYKNLKQFPENYCEIYNKSFYLVLSSKNCN